MPPAAAPFRSPCCFRIRSACARQWDLGLAALGLALLLIPAGCAHRARRDASLPVRVNATAQAPLQKGAAFHVVSAQGAGTEATLLYAEAARTVKAALEARGLYEALGKANPSVVVEIDYGMAAPRASERNPVDPKAASVRDRSRNDDPNRRSAERGPLVKHLVLTAREGKGADGSPPRVLWRVELTATDESNDIRKYLPMLAAAGIDQMGVDSGGQVTVDVDEKDKTIGLLKKAR
jgi:hypothetical protein